MEVLDLNSFIIPSMKVILRDKEKTVVRVTTPTLKQAEDLKTALKLCNEILQNHSDDTERVIFEFVAALISNNREHFTVTAKELKEKYDFDIDFAILFLHKYTDFLNGVSNLKN